MLDKEPSRAAPRWIILLYPVLALAGLGFVLTLAANLTVRLGFALPNGFPAESLFTGIFVVWLPTVLVMSKTTNSAPRRDIWKVALSGAPSWMRLLLYGAIGYGALNFLIYIGSAPAKSVGRITSAAEFVRFGSGHCLIFYGLAFVTLYSAISAPRLFARKVCPSGHTVSLRDRFCPECGATLQSIPNQTIDPS